MPRMIEIISATRLSEAEFWKKSPLAASLKRLLPNPQSAEKMPFSWGAFIAYANRKPLADVYNQRITATGSDAILVFVHDDVWIEDFFLAQRLTDGLSHYDVIGIAGNRERAPRQVMWSGDYGLSGGIAHGRFSFGQVSIYGETPAECELLDGVLLAARRSVLQKHNLLFDPQFDFHMYDMDFSRVARSKGLRLGTWPIAITHQSRGSWDADWAVKRDLYLRKWPD